MKVFNINDFAKIQDAFENATREIRNILMKSETMCLIICTKCDYNWIVKAEELKEVSCCPFCKYSKKK